MSPIEALNFALIKRFAQEYVPELMHEDFDAVFRQAQQIMASNPLRSDWIEKY